MDYSTFEKIFFFNIDDYDEKDKSYEDYAFVPKEILLGNIFWFCQLRWLVIFIVIFFGVVSYIQPITKKFGLQGNLIWPYIIGLVLIVANILFFIHAKFFCKSSFVKQVNSNLWGQIVFDLFILTIVVHYVGSIETVIPFVYLFHIILSCIFFERFESFIVTIISVFLYISCVLLEMMQLIPEGGIYAQTILRTNIETLPGRVIVHVLSSVTIWIVVWYLASRLSNSLRKKEKKIRAMNTKLRKTQEEKMKHMIRTTHELKSPFAAIHANTEFLLGGYCGKLTPEALDIIQKISKRCKALADAIQKMLYISKLDSVTNSTKKEVVELETILLWSLEYLKQIAVKKNISIIKDIQPAEIIGIEEYIKILLSNIIANAIIYSKVNGKIFIKCSETENKKPVVIIEDQGIGIAEDKLPYIFEDYYRTEEASAHNKISSGLGLGIVRRIAVSHKIKIKIESIENIGTKFYLFF